jgi:CheY-like chemotaxis protein
MSENKRKIRVLIFEDEAAIRHLFVRLLSRRDYEILQYPNPTTCPLNDQDACECSKDGNLCTDIILSDIKMPGLDGMSFIENQLKKGCAINPDNILVISGYWTSDLEETAKRLGVRRLRKPFHMDELYDNLDECEQNLDLNRPLVSADEIKPKDEKD